MPGTTIEIEPTTDATKKLGLEDFVVSLTQYNYKCPECGGEFNYPAVEYGCGTDSTYKCPFCGKKMEGMP